MRTSLIETEQIEAHLLRLNAPGDALVFEAELLLDNELSEKLKWQHTTYGMIRQYSRRQLKYEIEAVHQSLFNEAKHKSFGDKIRQLFKKR